MQIDLIIKGGDFVVALYHVAGAIALHALVQFVTSIIRARQ
jgi:hypothetical protein